MVTLTPDQTINLIVGLLLLIPASFLFNHYRVTKITDFLLFAMVFVASTIGALASVLVSINEILFFYQINVGMINLTFLLLFIHGIRLRFESMRKSYILPLFGFSYFAVLTILILFWEIQIQPDKAVVLFAEMSASAAPGHPHGAGLTFDDRIIYSTSFYILGLFFWIFTIVFLIWAYSGVEMINPTKNIQKARKIWLLTWIIDLIWAILLLPIFPQIQEINALLLVTSGLIIYNTMKYPESTLISNDQIVRYQGLYKRITSLENDLRDNDFGLASLVKYLESLPEDLKKD